MKNKKLAKQIREQAKKDFKDWEDRKAKMPPKEREKHMRIATRFAKKCESQIIPQEER